MRNRENVGVGDWETPRLLGAKPEARCRESRRRRELMKNKPGRQCRNA
jgi:hypothetical protein